MWCPSMTSKIDWAAVAVAIGPMLLIGAIIAIGVEFRGTASELHSHVLRVFTRDRAWEPALKEIHEYVKYNERHMQEQDRRLDEILQIQKDILAQFTKAKLGELMGERKTSPYAGVTLGEIHSHHSAP